MTKNKWEILGTFDGEIWIGNKDGYGPLVKARSQKIAEYTIKCVNGWDNLVKQRDALLEACKLAVIIHYTNDIEISPASQKCQQMLVAAIQQAEKEGE
jgi:hypothetical protein